LYCRQTLLVRILVGVGVCWASVVLVAFGAHGRVELTGTALAGVGSGMAASSYASCDLTRLRATIGLQGATGSMLGGITLRNPGRTCRLSASPVVALMWHGLRVTPAQRPFDPRAFRSIGPFRLNRTLVHGKALFVWLQWWNYCGTKPWGTGSFRPVAILSVKGKPGSVRAVFRDTIVPPYCNSPKSSKFSVSDFGTTP
jgi:hypothetical protein